MPPEEMLTLKTRSASSSLFACFCIALLAVLVYGNTLEVPWYYDDIPNIVENCSIRNFGKACNSLFSAARGVAQLTFALNYHFGGLDVFGYHVVNIAIHIATACIILLILRRIFPSPSLLPLLGALLFLAHPLQTQAVTYIVQRMTSLSGFFFFLALYFFIRSREVRARDAETFSAHCLGFYLSALCSGATAVLIKQNAAILPLAILLFEHYFLQPMEGRAKKRLLYVLPFCLVPLWLAVQDLLLPMLHGKSPVAITGSALLYSQRQTTILNYLVTECSVIWTYIRLLFLPYDQALDYSYPLVKHLLSWRNILATLGIAALLGTAHCIRRKSPLISFGIFWFFLALSVESTFIPLDPLFEHRLYVPLFGFVLVVIGLFLLLPQPIRIEPLLLTLILLLSVTAWQRNALWNDPIAFHEDNLRLTPWSEQVRVSLAKAYMDAGRLDEAKALLEAAIRINPAYDTSYVNLGLIQIDQEDYNAALATLHRGLQVNNKRPEFHDFIGSIYLKRGQNTLALEHLNQAIAFGPLYPNAYLNLGTAHMTLDNLSAAETAYLKAISLSHENITAHYNLGLVYRRQKRLREAQQEFLYVTIKSPDDAEALFSFAMASLALGEQQQARAVLPRLQELNAVAAEELRAQLHN